MERNQLTAKSRSRSQICVLSVLCLLFGSGAWYLAHSLSKTSSDVRQMETLSKPASAATVTPDQLKQMADKQAESLLARLQRTPEDAVLLSDIGKIYFQTGQFSVAVKYYEDSVRIKPDAAILVKLGGAYHFAGNDDKAISTWNRALSFDPNNPDALFNIGLVKWRAKRDREGAIAAWQKLLRTNPNHPKRDQVEKLLDQAKQRPETPIASNK